MDEFSLLIRVRYLFIFFWHFLMNFYFGRIDRPMAMDRDPNARDAGKAMTVGTDANAPAPNNVLIHSGPTNIITCHGRPPAMFYTHPGASPLLSLIHYSIHL